MDNTNSGFFFKTKLSLIQKICLAGLFTALVVILQKVLAINYIAIIPFVRVSFGSIALIIFSSILLGPIYGMCVGALSDVLGWLIFDPKTMGFFPTITILYGVLGLLAYFVFCLIRQLRNKKLLICVEYLTYALVLAFVALFIGLNSQINLYGAVYDIELWQKITIPCILLVLFLGLVIFNFFVGKFFEKKYQTIAMSVHHVSFVSFICEIFIMVLFGSLMKAVAFGFETYLAILLTQCIVAFINIPISTIVISYALLLTKRYYN